MLKKLFLYMSESRGMRSFSENSRFGSRFSHRFVAGNTIDDAIRATVEMNRIGMSATLDNLGENVTNLEEARHSVALYVDLLDEISARSLDANVSLKLTHMGLDVDPAIALEMVSQLVARAASMNSFVRIDMEGSPYTLRTLDFVRALHRRPGHANHIGAVVQAYLHRSEKDVNDLLGDRIRIRLCKGAYKESPEIAFAEKKDVDANYVKLMKRMMKSGVYHGLATHDPVMIAEATRFARAEGIRSDQFEFQMLYGVRRDLQVKLVKEGWRMRVYIPFGTEWYPYFMRRLAERPANVVFIMKNLLR